MNEIVKNLNEPLKPALADKLFMFHDLNIGKEAEIMMEYNPVLSMAIFVEIEQQVEVW